MWLAALLCLAHGAGAGLVVVDVDAAPEPLAPHITTWIDERGTASLADARAHLDAGDNVVVGAPNLGLRRAVFWVRLPLRSVSDDRWVVRAGFPRPQHAEVWSLAGDVVVDHAISGIELAPSARTIANTEVLLPLARTADVAYFRFDSRPARLALDVASAQVRTREQVTAGRFSGLYYGIVAGLFLFNLAFGLATRDAAVAETDCAGVGARPLAGPACIDDVRRLSRALAPALLERLGLISALRALCDAHQKATGVVVTLRTSLDAAAVAPLAADRSIHAFRVVQEALANATRHGAPQRIDVDVALVDDGHAFVVRVDDDGGGGDGDVRFGNGLHGMEQRAQLLGGTLRFSSSERGCVVEMQVPWPPAPSLTEPTPAPDNAA